jgi:hypothetical protein
MERFRRNIIALTLVLLIVFISVLSSSAINGKAVGNKSGSEFDLTEKGSESGPAFTDEPELVYGMSETEANGGEMNTSAEGEQLSSSALITVPKISFVHTLDQKQYPITIYNPQIKDRVNDSLSTAETNCITGDAAYISSCSAIIEGSYNNTESGTIYFGYKIAETEEGVYSDSAASYYWVLADQTSPVVLETTVYLLPATTYYYSAVIYNLTTRSTVYGGVKSFTTSHAEIRPLENKLTNLKSYSWYSYAPADTGWYELGSDKLALLYIFDEDLKLIARNINSDTDLAIEALLNKGSKYLIFIYPQTFDEYSLSISPFLIPALGSDYIDFNTVMQGYSTFKFTAAQTGIYNLDFEGIPGYYTIYDENMANPYEAPYNASSSEKLLFANKSYYIVYTAFAEGCCRGRITYTELGEIPELTETSLLQLPEKIGRMYSKFTPSSNGTYILTLPVNTQMAELYYIDGTHLAASVTGPYTSTLTCDLAAGKTYLYEFILIGTPGLSVSLSKVSASAGASDSGYAISAELVSVNDADHSATVKVSWEAPKDSEFDAGLYFGLSPESLYNGYVSPVRKGYYRTDSGTEYSLEALKEFTKYYYRPYIYDISSGKYYYGDTGSFTTGASSAPSLSNGIIEVNKAEAYHRYMFSFSPPTDGVYKLAATTAGNIVVYNSKMVQVTAAFNNFGNCVTFKNLYSYEYYYISFSSYKAGDFKLSAEEYKPSVMTPDSFFSLHAAPDSPQCVELTQVSSPVIEAYCDCEKGAVTIYDSDFSWLSNGTSYDGGSARACAVVSPGKSIYIVVIPEEEGNYAFSVVSLSPPVVGTEPLSIEAEKRTAEILVYTPQQDGFYDYTVTSEEAFKQGTASSFALPLYTAVLNSDGWHLAGSDVYDRTAVRKVWLSAGETYYLSFKPYAAGSHTVTVSPSALTELIPDKAYELTSDTVFTLKPQANTAYNLSTTDLDAFIRVYDSKGNVLIAKFAHEKKSLLSFSLTGGKTYYISVFPGTGGGVCSLIQKQ